MQAEAGQTLDAIIARKELERRTGDGIFFWGVGNAPARVTPQLARLAHTVQVYFSVMKGKPRKVDATPGQVLVWSRYVDCDGIVRPLPEHVLVTSRGSTSTVMKRRHYALVCRSEEPLVLGDYGPFDPGFFKNYSGTGRPVGASQVTALVCRAKQGKRRSEYRVNLTATLTGSYWVRLTDPFLLDGTGRDLIERRPKSADRSSWRSLVRKIRQLCMGAAAVGEEREPCFI